MPVSLIITLLTTFGPSAVQLITSLINKWETNGTVTAAEWATLSASLTQTAKDRMKLQLTAAGIDPASPQGVALLALVQ
jgi:sensor domain CHASE-containing protein